MATREEPSDYDAFRERYRARLKGELAEIRALLALTGDDSAPVVLDQQNAGRLSRMDAMRSQAMASETRRRREIRCQQIDAALRRIADGEFGWCAECGEFIGEGRLDADPVFHLCVRCAGR